MHREQIKALALANGFKLKQQPDGTEDLNPYVYEFAAALMAPLQAELKRQQDENKRLLFANRYNADMYRQIDDERKRLQAEVARLRKDNDHQRERRNAARDAIEKGKAERRAIEQECNRLKEALIKVRNAIQGSPDNVFAFSEQSLAAHDAEVIKQAGAYLHKMGLINTTAHLMLKHHANQMLCASNQAKEVQS